MKEMKRPKMTLIEGQLRHQLQPALPLPVSHLICRMLYLKAQKRQVTEYWGCPTDSMTCDEQEKRVSLLGGGRTALVSSWQLDLSGGSSLSPMLGEAGAVFFVRLQCVFAG